MWFLLLQARRQISSLLQEGKASVQQGKPMDALELFKQVRICVRSIDMSEQAEPNTMLLTPQIYNVTW